MPRKAFVADLQEAVAKFQRFNVTDLKAGEEDGMITFEYSHDGVATEIVSQVLGTSSFCAFSSFYVWIQPPPFSTFCFMSLADLHNRWYYKTLCDCLPHLTSE